MVIRMTSKSFTDQYINYVKENKDIVNDYLDVVNQMEQSDAKYKGETIPFLYQPIFFTDDEVEEFKQIANIFMSITNKVVRQFVSSPTYRQKFGYSELLEKLILADHGYQTNVPIGRFDLFYGGKNQYTFCELNTDGSSAMNEDHTLSSILLNTKPIQALKQDYHIEKFELFDSWVNECIKIYREFNPNNPKPTVAIVDFEGSGTPTDFIAFKKAYERKGLKTFILDPRDLTYQENKLYYQDTVIDFIYRRIVTRELIDRSDEIQDLIEAYLNQDVCMVGPIKSQIMHNKIIFKILHDNDTLSFLNEAEQTFIKEHIPFTDELSNQYLDEVLNNKDRYVIKPKDLYASKGVYVGRDYTIKEWKTLVMECLTLDYLIQDFCVPYTRPFVEFDDGQLEVSDFRFITGLYIYNEQLAGLYTRIGKGNVISGLHDYYTVSNLQVSEKK